MAIERYHIGIYVLHYLHLFRFILNRQLDSILFSENFD